MPSLFQELQEQTASLDSSEIWMRTSSSIWLHNLSTTFQSVSKPEITYCNCPRHLHINIAWFLSFKVITSCAVFLLSNFHASKFYAKRSIDVDTPMSYIEFITRSVLTYIDLKSVSSSVGDSLSLLFCQCQHIFDCPTSFLLFACVNEFCEVLVLFCRELEWIYLTVFLFLLDLDKV